MSRVTTTLLFLSSLPDLGACFLFRWQTFLCADEDTGQ